MQLDKCIMAVSIVLILISVQVFFADEFTQALKEEFRGAGVDLRLDRDEVLKSKYKIFDGFVVDPEKAYRCGIHKASGEKHEEGELAYFQIRPNGELRQVYLGHLILKRRHRETGPNDIPHSRIIMKAEARKKGKKLCEQE